MLNADDCFEPTWLVPIIVCDCYCFTLPSTTIDCQCSSVPSTGKQTIFIFTQLSAIVWSLFHISEPWGVCTFNNFFRTHHYHPFRRVLISEGVDFPFSREKSPESRLFLISQPCPWIRHNPTLIPSQTLFFFFSTHIWAPTHPSPLNQTPFLLPMLSCSPITTSQFFNAT